ncbi:MAG: hypothetical protein K6T65_05215 [Peptococcaceae bacterium]|nr:hypothetical protein [Peptococcaceae bacterium]
MEKLPIDLGALPEPFKSMAGNLDPEMIKNLISMYDPATLTTLMSSMLALMKESLSPEQSGALKELMENVMKLVQQQK